jgi:hypothetical protein
VSNSRRMVCGIRAVRASELPSLASGRSTVRWASGTVDAVFTGVVVCADLSHLCSSAPDYVD